MCHLRKIWLKVASVGNYREEFEVDEELIRSEKASNSCRRTDGEFGSRDVCALRKNAGYR